MKKEIKKLQLKKSSIANLTPGEMAHKQGGTIVSYTGTYYYGQMLGGMIIGSYVGSNSSWGFCAYH